MNRPDAPYGWSTDTDSTRWRKAVLFGLILLNPIIGAATTYYVSSATGSDLDNGLTPETAFATIAKVNTLALGPGDEVRLLCGETWRADPLIITRSGSPGTPIVFSSHPVGCADRPVLSGAHPVSGWVASGPSLWMADLTAGGNAGLFPSGVNQVFLGSERLPFGRWPDIAGHADGGWASVDSQPSGNQISDAELPAVDWTGAFLHIRTIRWLILNREVVSDSGNTLTLGDALSCWNGCAQWGYFLSNHLNTLNLDGEWFWDDSNNRLYLYSALGPPADGEIEASAILAGDGDYLGGVILGRHLQEHITDITIENLTIERWFANGITTPINLEADENARLIIRGNLIRDVDDAGIRLTTWVWNAAANGNGPDGWRGGTDQLVEDNRIERANHFGIDTYSRNTQFVENTIVDVGRLPYLGPSGMGCGLTGSNCTENGDGIRIKRGGSSGNHSGLGNTLLRNTLERIGMNGIDVFGYDNTITTNVVRKACISKGDCGGIRTFGDGSLATTHVHDISITGNLFLDTLGNTEGTHPDYRALFGFGIYIDNYSRDIEVRGNTVAGSSYSGLLFQRSTGEAVDNTVYDNGTEGSWGSELRLVGTETVVESTGNVFFGLPSTQRTMNADALANLLLSDGNAFFSPYRDAGIDVGGVWRDLPGWQTFSGLDGLSSAHWYLQGAGDYPWSRILINDGIVSRSVGIGPGCVDLAMDPAGSPIILDPYSSTVLVCENLLFADGFEGGEASEWTVGIP